MVTSLEQGPFPTRHYFQAKKVPMEFLIHAGRLRVTVFCPEYSTGLQATAASLYMAGEVWGGGGIWEVPWERPGSTPNHWI